MKAPVRAAFLLPILALAVAAPAHGAVPAGFSESNVASGLDQPTAIAFLPDGAMLVTQKAGALVLVRANQQVSLTSIAVCTDKSMGLLGIAVDPGFSSNGFIYLYRTKPAGGEGPACPTEPGRVNEVVRLRLEGDRVVGGPTAIFSGIRTDNGQHNGGTLRLGLDGMLYVSTGDTGVGDFRPGGGITPPGQSTNPFAQDLAQLPGKVLRIGLDGSVPLDNPFAAVAGARPEVFAYGFRNPFRFGIDPVTGSLWLGDVGQNTWEELNIVRAGGNYGWPRCEGTDPPGCDPPGHVPPVFQYQQDIVGSLGASITGGAFSPCDYGAFGGQYFFGDYASDRLYRAVPNEARDGLAAPPAGFADQAAGPVDIVFGPDAALYYVAIKAGEVRRVATQSALCGNGSHTGTPTPNASAEPAAGVVDKTPPVFRLRYRPRQRLGPLVLRVRFQEAVTVSASANARIRGTKTPYRYRPVKRSLAAGAMSRIALRLSERTFSALRRGNRQRPVVARARVTAADAGGNVAKRTARIHVVRKQKPSPGAK